MINKVIFIEHPVNCIVCGNNSFGEPQCENCLNNSKKLANKLSLKKKYAKKPQKLKEYFFNTFAKIGNEWNREKKQSLCNQLIGIGIFCNSLNIDNIDFIDEAYRMVDSLN